MEQDLMQSIWSASNPQKEVEKLIQSNTTLKNNLQELKQIYNSLHTQGIIQKAIIKRSKLSPLLNNSGEKIILNEGVNKELILEEILKAYHLTSKILQQLGLIKEVKYTFTFIDNNGNFIRAEDMTLDISDVRLEAASKGRGYSIRLKQESIKAKINASSASAEANARINAHFQKFAEPFYEHQNKSSTNWKINKGVLAETFERHWENLQHTIQHPEDLHDGAPDLESIGIRWLMYRQSSGSDPYFTGPDTMYAQVKNANASFVDNIDTVLNTMNAIIQITENANNIPNLTEKLEKAFMTSPEKKNISNKIWKDLDKITQQEIIKAFNATSVKQKGNIIIFE